MKISKPKSGILDLFNFMELLKIISFQINLTVWISETISKQTIE